MSYMINYVHRILGQVSILVDWMTCPVTTVHSPEQKAELNAQSAKLALYVFRMCPYCLKTYCVIRRLGLNIELRNTRKEPKWEQELIREGGKYQVPCLRIINDNDSIEWLYESNDINRYLVERFGDH
jgi:glutaredoxin